MFKSLKVIDNYKEKGNYLTVILLCVTLYFPNITRNSMNMDNPFKIKPHVTTIHIMLKLKIKKTLEAKMCKIDYTCTSTFVFNLIMTIYCYVLRYCYFL